MAGVPCLTPVPVYYTDATQPTHQRHYKELVVPTVVAGALVLFFTATRTPRQTSTWTTTMRTVAHPSTSRSISQTSARHATTSSKSTIIQPLVLPSLKVPEQNGFPNATPSISGIMHISLWLPAVAALGAAAAFFTRSRHHQSPTMLSISATSGAPGGDGLPLALDRFCERQFDDPAYKGTRLVGISKGAFAQAVNEYYIKAQAAAAAADSNAEWPGLVDGYAPFCKHLIMPNFLPDCIVPVAEITDANRHLLVTGYNARKPEELPVLERWFPVGSVPATQAKYLDIILYSREQIQKENTAMGLPQQDTNAPWGIISVKAQDEPYETPMQPITIMRNALISEGGSGVPIERKAYMTSVEYWRNRAVIA